MYVGWNLCCNYISVFLGLLFPDFLNLQIIGLRTIHVAVTYYIVNFIFDIFFICTKSKYIILMKLTDQLDDHLLWIRISTQFDELIMYQY